MRTLQNHYSTIVVLDRDDVSTTLMELFLQHAGYVGTVIKFNSIEQAQAFLEVSEKPVLLITDFFTHYMDNFNFFEDYRKTADKIIVVGEFEEEVKRFMKMYGNMTFYKKPHTVAEVKSWLLAEHSK